MEQIAEELMRFYRSMKWKPDIDPDSVADYRGVKWRIVPKLVSRGKNEALLREQPFAAWLDLAVTFYVLIDAGGNGTTTMPVCHSHLKKWGITTKTLYESAMLNAPCLLPAELLSIDGIIRELSCSGAVRPDNLLKEGAAADRMYVLSNQIRCFGAACILYPRMGRLIADVLRESYYVLPSSVHETIIVPKSSGFTREMFGDMIREVNTTHLEEEDILSEHAYYYDRKKDEFSL